MHTDVSKKMLASRKTLIDMRRALHFFCILLPCMYAGSLSAQTQDFFENPTSPPLREQRVALGYNLERLSGGGLFAAYFHPKWYGALSLSITDGKKLDVPAALQFGLRAGLPVARWCYPYAGLQLAANAGGSEQRGDFKILPEAGMAFHLLQRLPLSLAGHIGCSYGQTDSQGRRRLLPSLGLGIAF